MQTVKKQREEFWAHLWRVVAEEAPEVIDDLQTLQPVYAAAAGAIEQNRVFDWFSLERACQESGDPTLARLRDAIRVWAGRWSLTGPTEPLDEALSFLFRRSVYPKARFGLGGVLVYDLLTLELPKFPEFDPVLGDWSDFERAARAAFEDWLERMKSLAAVAHERTKVEKHALWLVKRLRGLTYSEIADSEKTPIGEDTVLKAVKRLAKELELHQL